MKRSRVVWLGVAGVLVAGLTGSLGFVAGQVVSPQQRAAMASPPPVTEPTAKVEQRVLNQTTVARGVVRFPSQRTVGLPAEDGVVTHTWLKAGKKVKAGTFLLEINGHPVIALPSKFSPYRDLNPGDSGRDVKVLKAALAQMGLTVSGYSTLQSSELASLDQYFRKKGYQLPVNPTECPEADDDTEAAKPEQSKSKDAQSCVVTEKLSLPAAWWVGIKDLPVVVASAGPKVGTAPTESSTPLTVSGGGLVLDVTFPAEPIEITADSELTFVGDDGQDQEWTVDSVDPLKPDESGEERFRVHTSEKIDAGLADATGMVRFGSADATPVLAVPLTALAAGADGSVIVRVRAKDEGWDEIPVEVGTQADGWAAVTDNSGRLHAGAEVLLG